MACFSFDQQVLCPRSEGFLTLSLCFKYSLTELSDTDQLTWKYSTTQNQNDCRKLPLAEKYIFGIHELITAQAVETLRAQLFESRLTLIHV